MCFAAVSTAGFGAQTYWISLCAPGAYTGPVATSFSSLLPFKWIEQYKVTPGQKVSALSNDSVAGTLVLMELSNYWQLAMARFGGK